MVRGFNVLEDYCREKVGSMKMKPLKSLEKTIEPSRKICG
jgi:hypothetical protein